MHIMLFSSVLLALPAAFFLVGAQRDGVQRQTSLDQFIKDQADISIKGVLANIGTDGSNAQGAATGIVIASPSRSDPDCNRITSLWH
jgi:glucoamylase